MAVLNSWIHDPADLDVLTEEQQVGLDIYMVANPGASFSNHSLVRYDMENALILEHSACQQTSEHVEPCTCIVWRNGATKWEKCRTYGERKGD